MSAAQTQHSAHIGKYHALLKRITSVGSDPLFPTEASKSARRRVLKAELACMGGLAEYQAASRSGEVHGGGFNASQWVVRELEEHSVRHTSGAKAISILDVGSIVARFPPEITRSDGMVALNVRSIDLSPQDEVVERADFFDVAAAGIAEGVKYDVIVLSLVVNFVSSPQLRGEMLVRTHALLAETGLCYCVLPAATVTNSRYFNEDRFRQTLAAAGLGVVRLCKSAKLMTVVCKRAVPARDAETLRLVSTKRMLHHGTGRNNFCIILASPDPTARRPAKAKVVKSPSKKQVRPAAKALTASARRKRDALAKIIAKKPATPVLTSNQRKRARRRAKQSQKHSQV